MHDFGIRTPLNEVEYDKWDPSNPNELLYEGLIKSYNDNIVSLLTNLGISGRHHKPSQIEIDHNFTEEQAKKLKQVLSVAGWYVSLPKDPNNKDPDWWFNSKYYLKQKVCNATIH